MDPVVVGLSADVQHDNHYHAPVNGTVVHAKELDKDILLFSKGLTTGAIQTGLGNQVTVYKAGIEPDGE